MADHVRLNALLARRVGISRREADRQIEAGAVTVNGHVARLGEQVKPGDGIFFNHQPVPDSPKTTTILFHKPVGYVSSRKQQGDDPTIFKLLPAKYHDLKPAGRLDKDSSGLMILSNDGQLIYRLTHPSFEKEKVYQISLIKELSPHNKALIETGVQLDDGPSKLQLDGEGKDWTVRMHEGRNRQIRRTFEAVDNKVVRLHRTQLGSHRLGRLAPGKFEQV